MALVHEAYLRLGDGASADRSGFLRAAAVAMQRILVDQARRKRAAKRDGRARQLNTILRACFRSNPGGTRSQRNAKASIWLSHPTHTASLTNNVSFSHSV
jgi:hypothetical protein